MADWPRLRYIVQCRSIGAHEYREFCFTRPLDCLEQVSNPAKFACAATHSSLSAPPWRRVPGLPQSPNVSRLMRHYLPSLDSLDSWMANAWQFENRFARKAAASQAGSSSSLALNQAGSELCKEK